MRNVQIVAQHKLESMLARSEGKLDFRLPPTEVLQMLRHRHWRIQGRQSRSVDQEVMVPRVFLVDTGRCDSHSLQPETDRKSGIDHFSIGRRDDIDFCALRRRATLDGSVRDKSDRQK